MKAHVAFQVNARCNSLGRAEVSNTRDTHLSLVIVDDVSLEISIRGIDRSKYILNREFTRTTFNRMLNTLIIDIYLFH